MAYTDQATIEAFLKRTLSAYEVTLLPLVLASVDAWINDQLGGEYGTVSATTRYYDGGSAILDIDSATDITKVALVDSEETETNEYELNVDFEARPRNETMKTYLQRRNYLWPRGLGNIAVTAKFTLGTTVPNDIKYLATYMAGKLFSSAVTGELKQESIEGYSRTFKEYSSSDDVITSILAKYTNDEVVM